MAEWPIIAGALLGVLIAAAALWWAYFEIVALNVGTLSRKRLIAAGLLLALWPAATSVDALVALPLVAAVLAVLVGFEAVRFREARARIRTAP